MDENTTIGERIAYYRRRRGLTQEVLAGLAGISTSYLAKVEQGKRIVDRLSILLPLANALKIEANQLIGGVPLPVNGGGPTDPPRGIPAIRRELIAVRPPDRQPPTISYLRAEIERANRLMGQGAIEAVSSLLPELLAMGRAATTQDLPEAWSCLAWAYKLASRVAHTVGDQDVAWIAADRAISTAQRSGDKLLVAVCVRDLAFALSGMGLLDESMTVCSDATNGIAPTDATPVEGWSVWGSLHLTAAVSAARLQDKSEAWRLVQHAAGAADHVGSERNDYWQGFQPVNVSAHELAVALESGDAVSALRIADIVDVSGFRGGERRARFCIDVARAHAMRTDDAATVALLLEAERHSKETVHYQVLAHELVRVCLSRERQSRTPGLRGLAERIGALH